jgi:hypothetical protein
LTQTFGWTISEVTLTFTIATFVLGLAAFGGACGCAAPVHDGGADRRRALRPGVFLASFPGGRL